MINSGILCILGRAGLRMDFVAGWLGTLPNFADSNWYVDPITRQSRSTTSNVIDLRSEFDLKHCFAESCNLTLAPNSDTWYATKAHRINKCHWQYVVDGSIKIYKIVPFADIDQRQVQWEFFLKTYGKLEYNDSWTIDGLIQKQNINNNDRIEKLHELLSARITHNVFHTDHADANFPEIEYSKLFVPGGSIYMCNIMGIDVNSDYHNFWDAMLPLAHTPSTVTLWGKHWNIEDY